MEAERAQGERHGVRKDMPRPRPEPRSQHRPDQGIVLDEKGQEQPRDKARAQLVHRTDKVGR